MKGLCGILIKSEINRQGHGGDDKEGLEWANQNVCWILVECIINEQGHSGDNEGGLKLDCNDIEVLEITVVGVRNRVVSNLICQPNSVCEGLDEINGEISEVTVVTREVIMPLRSTVHLHADRWSFSLLLCWS